MPYRAGSVHNMTHCVQVSMMDGRGNAMFTSGPGATTGSAWDSEVTRPYCFYSPSGKVQVGRLKLPEQSRSLGPTASTARQGRYRSGSCAWNKGITGLIPAVCCSPG